MPNKLLVLDLDETLIFGNKGSIGIEPDFDIDEYVIYKRPYLDKFLQFCQEYFDVSVWTSANRAYAQAVVTGIFKDNYPLKFVWSRGKCVQRFNIQQNTDDFMKDLRKVKNQKGYSLENIIAIDDSPEKHSKNYGNLVQVTPFMGEPDDKELLLLMPYLLELKDAPNIRTIEKRDWQSRFS